MSQLSTAQIARAWAHICFFKVDTSI